MGLETETTSLAEDMPIRRSALDIERDAMMSGEVSPASQKSVDKELDAIEAKISEEVGGDARRVHDSLYYAEPEQDPTFVELLGSSSILEEDLSQIAGGETFFDEATHKRIIRDALRETVRFVGKYVPQDRLNEIFPGFKLEDIDIYDFLHTKISVFILSDKTFNEFWSTYIPDVKWVPDGYTATPSSFSPKGQFELPSIFLDLSERKIIVAKEVYAATLEKVKKEHKVPGAVLSEKDRRIIELNLKLLIAHESLHILNVAWDLPRPFKEGVVEWYAQQIIESSSGDYFYKNKRTQIKNPHETEGISILMTAMLENGVSRDTVDRALIASDREARGEIRDFLSNRYGKEATDRILAWDFESTTKSLRFIMSLESRQDSDIGRFLRAYGSKFLNS